MRPFRAREDLVPSAVERALALDEEGVPGRRGHELAQRHPRGEPLDLGGGGRAKAVHGGAVPVLEGREALVDLARVDAHTVGRLREALEDTHALCAHELLVDTRADLDLRVVDPGGVRVGPALDAVGPPAHPVGTNRRAPLRQADVVAVHGEVVVPAVRVSQHRLRVDRVVPLAEHPGPDDEVLPDDRLGRALTAVDDRSHVRDRDASDRGGAPRHALDGRGVADSLPGGQMSGSRLGVVGQADLGHRGRRGLGGRFRGRPVGRLGGLVRTGCRRGASHGIDRIECASVLTLSVGRGLHTRREASPAGRAHSTRSRPSGIRPGGCEED